MAPPKKVSTAKAAPATVDPSTAAVGDSQAPEDNKDLALAQADGQTLSTGADAGAGAADAAGVDAGAVAADAGAADAVTTGADAGAADAGSDPGDSNPTPSAGQVFRVVIRNHGSHAVNAGSGLQLLPCSSTPLPQYLDADDLELLRGELAKLEQENCLRPETLTADVTQITEIKA